jgi:tryptophan synthase beta subunit
MSDEPRVKILTIEVSDQYCKDVLVTCVEGGSNYWAEFRNIKRDSELDVLELECRDKEDEDALWKMVTISDIRRGVEVATKAEFQVAARIKSSILEDDNDAESSDVILQAAVFGEVIYG